MEPRPRARARSSSRGGRKPCCRCARSSSRRASMCVQGSTPRPRRSRPRRAELIRLSFSILSGISPSSRSRARWFPVAKQSPKSPLECSPMPPVRAIPKPARRASRSHWSGRSGGVRRDQDDDRARPLRDSPGSGTYVRADPFADRRRRSRAGAPAGRGSPARGRRPSSPSSSDPRRGADSALEAVADHAGAAADGALRDRAVASPARAPRARAPALTWKPLMSFRKPSQVSPTTGRLQSVLAGLDCGDERIANDSRPSACS